MVIRTLRAWLSAPPARRSVNPSAAGCRAVTGPAIDGMAPKDHACSNALAARMSRYLIDEISATANVDVRTRTHIAAAGGTGKLDTLTLTNTKTGSTQIIPASALMVLIGAVPHTDWLPPQIGRDEHGFVVTGSDLADGGNPAASWTLPRPPLPLETSLPGVFAAGDVRHGSVKRVASAVGEGSIAATQVTHYLQKQAEMSSRQGMNR